MGDAADAVWLPSDGLNDLHIYEVIAAGPAGKVNKVRKKGTIRYFALQCTEKNQRPRLMREVRSLHALDHKHIQKFYMWYETRRHLWTITEYCVGGNMAAIIKEDNFLPEQAVCAFATDLAVALQTLHSMGILHCDLGPSQILLNEDGHVKLAGFGKSRPFAKADCTDADSQEASTSLGYLAPEMFLEGAVYSTSSDIWALGCTIYHMATGGLPFPRMNSWSHPSKLLNAVLQRPSGISDGLWDLLQMLLTTDPRERATWEDLQQHGFWAKPMESREIPEAPCFAKFLSYKSFTDTFCHTTAGQESGQGASRAKSRDLADVSASPSPSKSGLHRSGLLSSDDTSVYHRRQPCSMHDEAVSRADQSEASPQSDAASDLLRKLIWHKSDSIVKSIVPVKRADASPRLGHMLPFATQSSGQLQKLSESQAQRFTSSLTDALTDPNPEKQAGTLEYVESICGNATIANMLLNFGFTQALLAMLKRPSAQSMRAKAISLIGLLIRHATYIGSDIAGLGILACITEMTAEDDIKMRRKAMASLGELLFFIASQEEEGGNIAHWNITAQTMDVVWDLLVIPDEVLQQCVLRSMENLAIVGKKSICSQSLRDESAVDRMLTLISLGSSSEATRGLACSVLSKIVRCSAQLLDVVANSPEDLKFLVTVLQEENQKALSACLSILCEVLSSSPKSQAAAEVFQDAEWLETLINVASAGTATVAAKAFVAHALTMTRFPLTACSNSLLAVTKLIIKAESNEDAYLANAASAWLKQLPSLIQAILQQIRGTAGKGLSLEESDAVWDVILTVLSSSSSIPAHALAESLLLELTSLISEPKPSGTLPQASVLKFLEALLSGPSLPLTAVWTNRVLPALAAVVQSNSEQPEAKFVALQVFNRLLPQLVRLDSPQDAEGRSGVVEAIERHVLPMVRTVLNSEEELMASSVLKLIDCMLEEQPDIAQIIERNGLSKVFLTYLNLEHHNNHISVVNICRVLLEQNAIAVELLAAHDLARKVVLIMDNARDESADFFLLPLLNLCASFVSAATRNRMKSPTWSWQLKHLVAATGLFLMLCQNEDVAVAAQAAFCLDALLQSQPKEMQRALSQSENAMELESILSSRSDASSHPADLHTCLQTIQAMSSQLASM